MLNTPPKKPYVSVVIPVFNGATVITETIESLRQQTFPNFEIIIADDASTDNTVEVIEALAQKDHRIRILKLEKNAGPAVARNKAIAIARGELIAFTDADDLSYPHRLQTQIIYLYEHPDIAVVGSAANFFGDATGLIVPVLSPEDFAACTMFTCEFFMSSLMFRRSVFDEMNIFFRVGDLRGINEDWEIIAQLVRHVKIANIAEPLIQYRRWDQQTTVRLIDTVDCFATQLRSEMLEWFGIPKAEQDLPAHIVMSPSYWPLEVVLDEEVSRERVVRWMEKILAVNRVNGKLNQASLERFMHRALEWLDMPASSQGVKCLPMQMSQSKPPQA